MWISFLGFLDALLSLPFLIALGVSTGLSRERNTQSLWVLEVTVAALASPIHETSSFKVGNQLA